jgi:hypothetical protein
MYPGGPVPQVGDHIYAIHQLPNSKLGPVAFITPSPVLLALEIAVNSAHAAAALRAEITPKFSGPQVAIPSIPTDQLDTLYRYFERCMVAVTFSFQAIEAFANGVITDGTNEPLQIIRRKRIGFWKWKKNRNVVTLMDAATVERQISTEEKVFSILPQIAPFKSPKGTELGKRLHRLKLHRDATTHLKGLDQYVRGEPDTTTLYYKLLNADPLEWPQTAIDVIKHFCGEAGLVWIQGAEALMKKERDSNIGTKSKPAGSQKRRRK